MSPNDGTMYKVFETKWWHLPKYLEIQSYSMMVVFEKKTTHVLSALNLLTFGNQALWICV